MRSILSVFWTASFLLVFAASHVSAAELASVPDASFSTSISGGGDSFLSGMSPDGRYILFSSLANNLVKRTNGLPYLAPHVFAANAFLHDRQLGTTALLSSDPTETYGASSDAVPIAVSTNGQYVLFESRATNLVAGVSNTNRPMNVYVRDVISRTTTLVTVGTNGVQANASSSASAMTPDGRYVVFASGATNLVVGDTNNLVDVFVRDMQSGTTKLVSVGAKGIANVSVPPSFGLGHTQECDSAVITPDGRYVCFMSTATNLVPGFKNFGEVYVRDLVSNTTVCVSSNAFHSTWTNPLCFDNEISDDGQFVTFQVVTNNSVSRSSIFRHQVATSTDELIALNGDLPGNYLNATQLHSTPDGRFVAFVGITNGGGGIFVWDAQSGSTVLASVALDGTAPTNANCDFPRLSSDGRFVMFACNATNLTGTTVGSGYHMYRRDLQDGITEIIDVGTNGDVPDRNLLLGDCFMSADGRFVAFDSSDADFALNDGNRASDVFVRDLTAETTELISQHDAEVPSQTSLHGYVGSGSSISPDGRYVAFAASGAGLFNNYTNNAREIIVRDLLMESNILVTVDQGGFGDANGDSIDPAISADGRFVAFASNATNLFDGDTNKDSDVFVRDLQLSSTALVSLNANNTGSSGGGSFSPVISADGRYILFLNNNILKLRDQTAATNYVLSPLSTKVGVITPSGRYIAYLQSGTPYIWDTQINGKIYTNSSLGSIFFMNLSPDGQWIAYVDASKIGLLDQISNSNRTVAAYGSAVPGLKFSADGNSLVYATSKSNSVDDINGVADVYVYDIPSGTNALVSRGFYSGKSANGRSEAPDISADGRFIVYGSLASDIVPFDNNNRKDVFLFDRQSGTTTLLSASSQAQNSANLDSRAPVFSGDGQTIMFHSWASDIATNDFDLNDDLFLVKILSSSAPTNPPPVLTGQILFYPGSVGNSGPSIPQLTWAAAPGFSYQVQYKTNLTDEAWLPVNGNVVIQNGVGYINDLAADPDHRFYRIVGY
jgi:Tol biopolymer transport system component